MPIEWLFAVGLVIAAGAWLVRSRRVRPASPLAAPAPEIALTPATLEPDDVLTFWDGRTVIVSTVFDGAEELGGRVTRWRWLLLDDQRAMQVVGEDMTLFEPPVLVRQGTALFTGLTGPPDAGGVLQQFEARARAGTVGLEPVRWQHEGEEYEMRSTGTFGATWRGAAPGPVWSDIAPDAAQNVYWTFEGRGGAVDGMAGLAIWTSHILLLLGRPLPGADLLGCYRGGDASRSAR